MNAFYAGYVSKLYIGLAYEFNSVIFTAARLPQIYSNYKVAYMPCHAGSRGHR